MPSATRPASEGGSEYASRSWRAIGGMTATLTIGARGAESPSATLTTAPIRAFASTSATACCYKNDMGRKNKALALFAIFLIAALTAGACSGSLAKSRSSDSRVEIADDGGEQEILDADDSAARDDEEFGRAEDDTAEGKSGKLLVSMTYLAMSLGAAALPFLVLL